MDERSERFSKKRPESRPRRTEKIRVGKGESAEFEDSDDEKSADDFKLGIRLGFGLPRRIDPLSDIHSQEVSILPRVVL